VEKKTLEIASSTMNVIMNVHEGWEKDDSEGYLKYFPQLYGKMKQDILKYSDIVAYAVVETDANGNPSYKWQIVKDEKRDAKCRFHAVTKYALKHGGKIPQHYGSLVDLIRKGDGKEAGYDGPIHMLVVGPSGSGKTFSLRTLKNVGETNGKN